MDMTPEDRNKINIQLRSQPWYQQWFQMKGLDPNHVQLNDQQRAELAKVAATNGMPLPPHIIIDPAGNANIQHGFAGQPTWLKALEIGAPIAATAGFGAAGMGPLGFLGSSAAPLGAGEAATTLGATGGVVPGLGLGAGELSTTLGATGGLVPGLSTAQKVASPLKSFLGNTRSIADAGKVLGGVGEAEANNRFNKGSMTQGYDRLNLEAAANRRTDESDALHKLAITNYLGQGGSHFQPGSIQLNGQNRQLPSFSGIAPPPVSDAQKAGASTLQEQLLKRLQEGGSVKPTNPDYLNRGKMENVGNYGSLLTTGLGVAKNIFGF